MKYMVIRLVNLNFDNGTIIKNLFLPSVRATSYGLKQLRVYGPRTSLPTKIQNATSQHIFYEKSISG